MSQMSAAEYRALQEQKNRQPKSGKKKAARQLLPTDDQAAMSAEAYLAYVKKLTPARQLEHQMQVAVVREFRRKYPHLARLLFAIPNGAKVTVIQRDNGESFSPERVRLVEEGMTSGVPDLQLCVARGEWHGLFVELKIHPNRPSTAQVEQMALLTAEGYCCQIGWTEDQCLQILDDYLALPKFSFSTSL